MSIRPGDTVVYRGRATLDQIRWGGNDDPDQPPTHVTVWQPYVVATVTVHSWHTKLTLVGVQGRFNSVHFEVRP